MNRLRSRAVVAGVGMLVLLALTVLPASAFIGSATVTAISSSSVQVAAGVATVAARVGYLGTLKWLPITLGGTPLGPALAVAALVAATGYVGYQGYNTYFADREVTPGDPDAVFRENAEGDLVVEEQTFAWPTMGTFPYYTNNTAIFSSIVMYGPYLNYNAAHAARTAVYASMEGTIRTYVSPNDDTTGDYDSIGIAWDPGTTKVGPYDALHLFAYPYTTPEYEGVERPVEADDLESRIAGDLSTPFDAAALDQMLQEAVIDTADAYDDPALPLAQAPGFPRVKDLIDAAINDGLENPAVETFKNEVEAMTPEELAAEQGATYQPSSRTTLNNPADITQPIIGEIEKLPAAIGVELDRVAEEANDSFGTPVDPVYDATITAVEKEDATSVLDAIWARIQSTTLADRLNMGVTHSGSPIVTGTVGVGGNSKSVEFDLGFMDGPLSLAGNIFLGLVVIRQTWGIFA